MKLRAVACAIFIGIAAVSCAAFGQTTVADVLPKLPAPAGPFGIGRIGYDSVDTSRPDQHSTAPNARRESMGYFWYPAQKSADPKGHYLPGAQFMDALPEVHQTRARART